MPSVAPPSPVGAQQAAPADPTRRRPRRSLLLTALVVGCAVVAVALWRAADSGPAPLSAADVDRAVQRGLAQSEAQRRAVPTDAVTAYRTISPSLVVVTTGGAGAGGGPSPATAEVGLGAGVVINAQGAVLTALHVVEGSTDIAVQFADGTRASARIATRAPDTDIAVLAVDRLPEVVVPAVMAAPPAVGDDVFAVGNPLGLLGSLTAGVVSANNRSVRTQQGRTLADLIQFDAAVNPGNSGGPLLNRGGQVVGIVTALANPSKQAYFVGIGFAVPIATASGAAGGPQQ